MLDTKLKNRHRLAVIVIICTIMLPVFYITGNYRAYYDSASIRADSSQKSYLNSEEFLGNFLDASYILYNKENGNEETTEIFEENFNGCLVNFEDIYPYLDYRVENEKREVVDSSTANTKRTLMKSNLSSYAFGLVLTYDEEGNPDIQEIQSEYADTQSVELRRILSNPEYNREELMYRSEEYGLGHPENRTYYFAMTEENLGKYVDMEYYEELSMPDYVINVILFLMLLVAGAAWVYPLVPFFYTGQEKIFRIPAEAAVLVLVCDVLFAANSSVWFIAQNEGAAGIWDHLYWLVAYAVIYWASGCLRQMYVLGPVEYLKKYSLLYASRSYVKRAWVFGKRKVTDGVKEAYHSLEKIDLSERNNKVILKIVIVNFLILTVVCMCWVFGIAALVVYSVILFFILRKYYDDLREKYAVLLKATNRIAEGDLEVEITEDLGVFSPFRSEIEKIQTGFKKAVDEEVKSQRMKTELITNVSHDLKTPLTAIITYVSLLKEEADEEKRNSYIEVLEKKSLRLKVLIEDLFEISKASSKNITLHIVDIDIVNLFKQVKLELEEKLQEADIEFRCIYPEGRLIVPLDSQKTYRIFENLLVNISKYAMPHTRAYVEIQKEGDEAVVRIKNISAAELTFNPEEITERFVRGDESRNTEGSGLGLAIVKSFTELQKGKFKVETEADLFKAEIRFPVRQ